MYRRLREQLVHNQFDIFDSILILSPKTFVFGVDPNRGLFIPRFQKMVGIEVLVQLRMPKRKTGFLEQPAQFSVTVRKTWHLQTEFTAD